MQINFRIVLKDGLFEWAYGFAGCSLHSDNMVLWSPQTILNLVSFFFFLMFNNKMEKNAVRRGDVLINTNSSLHSGKRGRVIRCVELKMRGNMCMSHPWHVTAGGPP